MLKNFIKGITSLIYPPICILCNDHISTNNPDKNFLCAKCRSKIKMNRPPFCPKCCRPLSEHHNDPICHICKKQTPYFDFAWAACYYEKPLTTLIHYFKYKNTLFLHKEFVLLIAKFIKKYNLDIQQFDMITPIPLFHARFRERGYNQAELLASSIAKHYNLPLNKKCISRIKNTKTQTLLGQKERWTNTNKAFRINNSKFQKDKIKNKSILLIDDLLTTGATASACAQVLKNDGAKTVGVLTLAIA